MVLMCANKKIDNTSFERPTGSVQKADAVVQVDGVLVVRLANGRFMTSARDFHKWAYTIGHDLRLREPVIRGLQKIGYITKDEADEHMAQNAAAIKRREHQHAAKYIRESADKLGLSLTPEQQTQLASIEQPA